MKFKIITLGCKVNMYESNYISESLENNGFSFCEETSSADIIIINTCTVTDTSDKKCLKMARRAKRENPNAILIICGCSSQNNAEPYVSLGANIVLGNTHKANIIDYINDYLKDHKNICEINKNRDIPFEEMNLQNFNQVRAYIKVQDGCNNFCSYCVIPFVRGTVRSRNFESIINEAKELTAKDFKEIVLTGIHTGSYNDSGKDLFDLINELSKIDGLERIRLSSVEITELNDKFFDILRNNPKFCNHVHIPLQAGSDEILKWMNRKYDTKYFEEKIKAIRSIRPDISITTDVIVGHNYETESLFLKSYEFCQKMGFAKIHVFPYSKRTGTLASRMPEEVEESVKKVRARKLINLSEILERKYYDSFKGQKLGVLVETVSDGKSFGHTSNYLGVTVNEELQVGKIYQREI